MTTAYYRDLIEASQATARNDLVAATAAALLRAEGRTRGRRYVPGARLMRAIAHELGGVEADREAILAALVDRSAETMEWFAPARDAPPPEQPALPGLERA